MPIRDATVVHLPTSARYLMGVGKPAISWCYFWYRHVRLRLADALRTNGQPSFAAKLTRNCHQLRRRSRRESSSSLIVRRCAKSGIDA